MSISQVCSDVFSIAFLQLNIHTISISPTKASNKQNWHILFRYLDSYSLPRQMAMAWKKNWRKQKILNI